MPACSNIGLASFGPIEFAKETGLAMGSSLRHRSFPSWRYSTVNVHSFPKSHANTEGEFQSRRMVPSMIRYPSSIIVRGIVRKSMFQYPGSSLTNNPISSASSTICR